MNRYAVTVNHPALGDLQIAVDAPDRTLAATLAEREAAAITRQRCHLARFLAWRVCRLDAVH